MHIKDERALRRELVALEKRIKQVRRLLVPFDEVVTQEQQAAEVGRQVGMYRSRLIRLIREGVQSDQVALNVQNSIVFLDPTYTKVFMQITDSLRDVDTVAYKQVLYDLKQLIKREGRTHD